MYVLEDPTAAQNIESKPPASAKSSKSLLIINCHQYLYWFNKFCYVQDAHTLCSKSRELIQDYNLHGCFVRVAEGTVATLLLWKFCIIFKEFTVKIVSSIKEACAPPSEFSVPTPNL